MTDDTWDLAEVLAERVQPKDSVTIYLNEAASYAKSQLVKAHARAKGQNVEEIDEKLTDIEAQLEASKYVVHLTGVPTRMREDIETKSLQRYPVKPDIMGRDDTNNALLRQKYRNDLLWTIHIEKVENSRGGVFNGVGDHAQIKRFAEALPAKAAQAIDKGIEALTLASEEYTVAAKGIDF